MLSDAPAVVAGGGRISETSSCIGSADGWMVGASGAAAGGVIAAPAVFGAESVWVVGWAVVVGGKAGSGDDMVSEADLGYDKARKVVRCG